MIQKINFKNILTILTTLTLTYSLNTIYSQDYSKYVRISGKITNPNGEKILIRGGNYKKEIMLNSKGEFSDTLNIKTGDYSFYDFKESTSMYLEPGYNLNITVNTKEFDETIKYSGNGEGPNNFLANYYIFNEQNSIDYSSYQKMSDKEFFEQEKEIFENSISLLNRSLISNRGFIEKQKEIILFDHLRKMINKVGDNYFSVNSNIDIKQYLDKKLEFINFNDSILFESQLSRNFLNSFLSAGLVANNPSCINIYNEVITEKQKKGIIRSLKRGISFYNLDHLDDYYSCLIKLIDDEKTLLTIKTKYKRIKSLEKGNISPLFNYADTSGNNISLESFRDKLVYIDVWATWCGPCKEQIPYLKKLEEKYRTKDIVFVSMSIDDPKDAIKWKKMIIDKELKGIQIMADKAWKSSFVLDYVIEGIPRFILIDKNGNIISSNAPRPATFNKGNYLLNEEIQTIFDENL